MNGNSLKLLLVIIITALISGGAVWYYNELNSVNEPVEAVEIVEDLLPDVEYEDEVVVNDEEEVADINEPVDSDVVEVEGASEIELDVDSAETVFEPITFTNKIYKYSIDHPKNWYWRHYGVVNGTDYAMFDVSDLPETLGNEYAGKIGVMVYTGAPDSSDKTILAENKKWLENVTEATHFYAEAWPIYIQRGEVPKDGLSMGSSNVRLTAFIFKDGKIYQMTATGPTPEEEKIFMQMVKSFRFENNLTEE